MVNPLDQAKIVTYDLAGTVSFLAEVHYLDVRCAPAPLKPM